MSAVVLAMAVAGAIVAGCASTAEATPESQVVELVDLEVNANRGW